MFRVPTRLSLRKATWTARQRERLTTRRGLRPWHVQTLLAREPGDLAFDQWRSAAGPHRKGEEP